MTTVQDAGILRRLRNETADVHGRLEQKIDVLSPRFSFQNYVQLLQGFYAVHAGWNDCAHGLLSSAVSDLAERLQHLERIESDLERLGHKPALVALDFSRVRTTAAALGCMYVLEGSTLGGQILSRTFAARFDIEALCGGAYFHGYGPRTGLMWRRFGEQLESWSAARPDTADEIVRGAEWMFAATGSCLPAVRQ